MRRGGLLVWWPERYALVGQINQWRAPEFGLTSGFFDPKVSYFLAGAFIGVEVRGVSCLHNMQYMYLR